MEQFRRIAIYCGSSNSVDASYFEAARQMGRYLADNGIGMVFGGGKVGLMGAAADGCREAGGNVVGVIPHRLQNLEVGHQGLDELLVVHGMPARKILMAELADGYIALPGGFGTWEELLEVTTTGMLNYHRKPCGLLNVNGYYDGLLAFIEHAQHEGFIRPKHYGLLCVDSDPERLLAKMAVFEMPDLNWVGQKT